MLGGGMLISERYLSGNQQATTAQNTAAQAQLNIQHSTFITFKK